MSHGNHSDHQHPENKPGTSLFSSFWLVVILAGLFICALNFVNVMGNSEEGKSEGEGPKVEAVKEAPTPAAEAPKSESVPAAPATDTAKH